MEHKIKFKEIILLEDDHYLVVSKPPGIATLEDRTDPVNLLALAKAYHPDAQACHRLDKETSGVLVFAKNPEAYRHLSLQFQQRKVEKIYHAVTDGIHRFEDVLVDKPILKSNEGPVKISKSGKPAQTRFTSLKAYRMHTLVSCRPITGRMHQIRVHLAFLGAPITGDAWYGGKPFFLSSVKRSFNLKKDTEEEALMKRVALHAFSIGFSDLSGETVKVEAPYPKDMRALIRQLELNG
ncbi:MAG TPA: RluA family pseudouridine synthase [Cyclobacteriaceae bacterium]|nr:RluA family pseudouridine synthase [Cyclobacteriaceae bacterium]